MVGYPVIKMPKSIIKEMIDSIENIFLNISEHLINIEILSKLQIKFAIEFETKANGIKKIYKVCK